MHEPREICMRLALLSIALAGAVLVEPRPCGGARFGDVGTVHGPGVRPGGQVHRPLQLDLAAGDAGSVEDHLRQGTALRREIGNTQSFLCALCASVSSVSKIS